LKQVFFDLLALLPHKKDQYQGFALNQKALGIIEIDQQFLN